MEYGICPQALVPVRVQPGDNQEMTNQLLFGDLVFIKGRVKEWLLIQTVDDEYEGWVDQKQVMVISKEEFNVLLNADRYYSLELSSNIYPETSHGNLMFTLGARLPNFEKGRFTLGGLNYLFPGKTGCDKEKSTSEEILSTAMKYLGSPYLWGGRSPFGIDCSGLVQMVFKMNGIFLPRDASQQVSEGKAVNFIEEAQPGDLAFFGEEDAKISHVGIIVDTGTLIHASGDVRIDKLDHQGIYNHNLKKYTHKLRVIKRLLY